ncbi:hypothetical protein M9H77_00953 [Catharanthus roseus]|uniref:Uncharacterized protein n=1 Tax=Catharanthus roseus TaxID=4058 RepID=A0ACC0C468_CATRO|nr:hypothetical protein M9H77_00953 [Catharanthus roseus]
MCEAALGRAVEEAKMRCEALEDRLIKTLKKFPSSSSPWKTTLFRLIRSELSFLNRYSLSLSCDSTNSHSIRSSNNSNPSLSVNIGHLESVIHILQQPFITGVSRVCKPVPLSSSQKLVRKADSGASSIYVDIVCCLNGKPVWFIVSDRNPKYITWHGSSANKGLRKRIQDVLQAAQSSETLRPSSLILFFSSGLDHIVHKKLQEEFGAADLELPFPCFDCAFFDEFEDEWINIVARSYQEACILEIEINSSVSIISTPRKECTVTQTSNLLSLKHVAVDLKLGDSFCSLVSGMNCCLPDSEIDQLKDLSCGHVQFVNFDTTALIAIVSGISNGGMDKLLATEESQLRNRFKGNYDFVLGQVNSEASSPINIELTGLLAGKGGIICQSVYAEFRELLSMCGGPNEKLRANHFLNHLKVVPDCPSSRMMSLPTTRKLALKNKVVFGTGDFFHAPTLTANMAFVRAVSQTGMSLFTIEHRPRALIGD